jgi:hypothetical protein
MDASQTVAAPARFGKGMVYGMDYVLSNLVPSTDIVQVPLNLPLGASMPPQNDDEFEPDEEEDLSEAETKRRLKRKFDIQSFNSYMLWMKRSDRQLYDDIKSKYG